MDLAGATFSEDQTFRVWLETWSAELDGSARPTVRLRATEENIAIDLTLESAKPLTLQGDGGYSQKGTDLGKASYYYSITRMPTTGTLSIGQQSFNVEGISWMDREWSTSALAEDQVGWDWFALQLSDGRDLMFYQLRLQDGGIDPHSSGTVIGADVPGEVITLHAVLYQEAFQFVGVVGEGGSLMGKGTLGNCSVRRRQTR